MRKSNLRSFILCLILVGIAALSLLPRGVSLDRHWSSDEVLWLGRSRYFMYALQHVDFPGTLQSHHPGVLTMWLAGGRLWAKYGDKIPTGADEDSGLISPATLAECRLMIAITTGIIILIAFYLIRRLLGTKIAILATIFLAVDPMYLAQARRLHTDALSASFLLLCILTLLNYLQDFKHSRYLILSGICFGFACLAKSYALIGLCYVPLLLLFFFHGHISIWVGRSFWIGLIWLAMACFSFVIGWPAILGYSVQLGSIWVPVAGITALSLLGISIWGVHKLKLFLQLEASDTSKISKSIQSALIVCGIGFGITAVVIHNSVFDFLGGIGWAVATQHEIPHLFLGKVINDPGLLFYPLMLSIQSAPLTLPLSLIGFLFLRRQRQDPKYTRTYEIYAGLAVFVILFTFCMTLGAKKMSRYLLPVFPVLDILAAVAGYILVEKVFQTGVLKRLLDKRTLVRNGFEVLTVGLIVLIQGVPVLRLQPHYGTYYNPCWKVTDITKICSIGGAYGLDLAADYLNEKPNPQALTVHVSPLSTSLFDHYFRGESYPRGSTLDAPSPDYEVAYIRDVQINRVHLSDIHGTLEHIIRLNGIDYVWIYRSRSP